MLTEVNAFSSNWEKNFFYHLEKDLNACRQQELGFYEENSVLNSVPPLIESDVLSANVEKFSLAHLNLDSFQAKLTAYNRNVIACVHEIFHREIADLSDHSFFCIATTGSDGREEKLCLRSSQIELMVIVTNKIDLEKVLIRKIHSVISKYPGFFYAQLEIKCLETDSLVNFNRNQDLKGPPDYRPFPTRALDVLFLEGSKQVMQEYQIKFFEELTNPSSGRLLRKFFNNAVKPTMKLIKTITEEKEHLEIETGKIHYDGERIKATKYPLLRVVQFQIADYICKKVNKKQIDRDMFFSFPRTIEERIQWLADKNLLDLKKEEIKELKEAYAASLVWFEKGQRTYETEKQTVTTVNPNELNQVVKSILKFGTSSTIFK